MVNSFAETEVHVLLDLNDAVANGVPVLPLIPEILVLVGVERGVTLLLFLLVIFLDDSVDFLLFELMKPVFLDESIDILRERFWVCRAGSIFSRVEVSLAEVFLDSPDL